MKKVHLSLLFSIILVLATSFSSPAQTKKYAELYLETLELNYQRFDSIDLIYPGDTVLLPELNGSGVVAWIAEEKDIETGEHDCVSLILEKYLAGTLVTVPADTIQVAVPTPVVITTPDEEKAGVIPTWLAWILGLLIVAFVSYLFYMIIFKNRNEKVDTTNPDSYPPVGTDLDKASDEEIVRSISKMLLPGEEMISYQKGNAIRLYGEPKLYVKMAFGDGVDRNVFILPDERVTKVKIRKDGFEYYRYARNICANGILFDPFDLKKGWIFQADGQEVALIPSVVEENVEVTTTDAPENSTTENSGGEKTTKVEEKEKTNSMPKEVSTEQLKAIAKLVGKVVSETESGDISLQMKDLNLKVTFSGKKSEKNEPIKERVGKVSEIIN